MVNKKFISLFFVLTAVLGMEESYCKVHKHNDAFLPIIIFMLDPIGEMVDNMGSMTVNSKECY